MSDYLDSISPVDEYGFQLRQRIYWLPETVGEEIARLEMNILKYEQYLLCDSKFPDEINRARLNDFIRLRELKRNIA